MGACTVPKLLGFQKWFDAIFREDCEWHDDRYVARDCTKLYADFMVCVRMVRRGWRYLPLALLAFVLLCTFPYAYWLWFTD